MAKAKGKKEPEQPARDKKRPPYGAMALAAACGLLLTASFPRTAQGWLAFFALVPLFGAINRGSARRAFGLGFLAGLVHFITLLYWLKEVMSYYGGLPAVLAWGLAVLLSACMALYLGAFAGLARYCAGGPLRFVAMAPVIWTGLEYLRSYLITGFPWCLLGYTQAQNLTLLQAADLFGVYGLSFAIVMLNAALFVVLRAIFKKEAFGAPAGARAGIVSAVLAAVLFGAWFAYGLIRLGEAGTHPAIRAAVVQGNIEQAVKWDPGQQYHTVRKYLDMAGKAAEQGAQLVVFPETALPFYFESEYALRKMVEKAADRAHADFIVGSPAFTLSGRDYLYYNSAYLLVPGKGMEGRYDKVHLVPWGEYVPLKKYMPFIEKLTQASGDFSSGRPGRILCHDPYCAGVAVCYEVIFPALVRQQVRAGANLLVNMTNDAWFGRSSAPYQHFSMAVFRAVEFRRSLIRAANTGISALVLPTGRVVGRTELFTDAISTFDVPLLSCATLYQRLGDLLPQVCGILSLLLILAAIRRKLENAPPARAPEEAGENP